MADRPEQRPRNEPPRRLPTTRVRGSVGWRARISTGSVDPHSSVGSVAVICRWTPNWRPASVWARRWASPARLVGGSDGASRSCTRQLPRGQDGLAAGLSSERNRPRLRPRCPQHRLRPSSYATCDAIPELPQPVPSPKGRRFIRWQRHTESGSAGEGQHGSPASAAAWAHRRPARGRQAAVRCTAGSSGDRAGRQAQPALDAVLEASERLDPFRRHHLAGDLAARTCGHPDCFDIAPKKVDHVGGEVCHETLIRQSGST